MARPAAITHVLRHTTDGKPVTVGDQIVASIGAGNYFEQSCEAAGIGKRTGYRWLREGALAARQLERATTAKARKLTRDQEAYLAFWHAVTEADARWEVQAVTTLETLARGGGTHTTVTEKKNAAGRVIETTTRTETLPPNVAVLLWRLERKFPDRYGRKVEVTTSVPDPLTRNDRAESIGDVLESYLAGRADKAAETEAGATPAPDGD